MCRLCGRDKFSKPGQPHRCAGGFRKRFKKAARLNGWDNCWVNLANAASERLAPRQVRLEKEGA
jgi:hypothetical protein